MREDMLREKARADFDPLKNENLAGPREIAARLLISVAGARP